jgi:4-amino-4-deoxy-L-arabinose transferase-like glycosyltransferase
MTTEKETRRRRGRFAKRRNHGSRSNVPGAGLSIPSTHDDLLSDQDGYGTTLRSATALLATNPWRGDEIATTASAEGNGHAGQLAGSRPIPRSDGTAETTTSRQEAGSRLALSQSGVTAAPSRRRTWVSRAVLLGVLAVQAVLSFQLQNTAFQDEALYLYAGHLQLDHLQQGRPPPGGFTAYFSGSPVLYPVLAAVVDSAFGLAGARALSLVFMLGATILVYSLSRLLFNERAGLCAAALFATTQSTLFLGHFATYDAAAIFLLALAAWIVVRSAHTSAIPACLVAALVMALGVAVKYATLMFLPTVIVLAALTAFGHRRWGGLVLRSILLCTFTAAILAGAIALAGKGYIDAIRVTTTARATGNADPVDLLRDCLLWGGGLLALGLFGTVSYVRRERLGEVPRISRDDDHARPWRLALGVLLCGTALLAPAYQIHLYTAVSLHKHIGYGLLFAAPMAGVGLSRIMGKHFQYPQLAIIFWVTLLTLGITQSQHLYHAWADSTQMVATVRQELEPKGRFLVENDAVPKYYLRTNTTPEQWTSTYFIDYTEKGGERLSGEQGYRAALRDGYFDVIVLDWTVTKELDDALVRQLRTNDQYRMLGRLAFETSYGKGYYEIWVKDQTT